jgi:cystathionine beta-lyase
LNNHPKLIPYYPGLPSDPFHEIAKSKCVVLEEWFLSISSPVKKEDAIDFLKNKTLPSQNLCGRVMANYSVMMAHASIPEDKRKEIGITDLVRLSVGIEDADDLIDDLKRALA